MIKGTWLEPLAWWVFSAIAVTGVSALVYVASQQVYRQLLNDPQIQMAEDGALVLASGGVPADVVSRGPLTDLQKSLSPWIAVYDSSGKPLEASGQLSGAPPQPPAELFDESTWIDPKTYITLAGDETRVTWQPQPDVRQALVLVHTPDKKYFVVAGRNMRVQEERVQQLTLNVALAWLFTLGCLFIASFVGYLLLKRF